MIPTTQNRKRKQKEKLYDGLSEGSINKIKAKKSDQPIQHCDRFIDQDENESDEEDNYRQPSPKSSRAFNSSTHDFVDRSNLNDQQHKEQIKKKKKPFQNFDRELDLDEQEQEEDNYNQARQKSRRSFNSTRCDLCDTPNILDLPEHWKSGKCPRTVEWTRGKRTRWLEITQRYDLDLEILADLNEKFRGKSQLIEAIKKQTGELKETTKIQKNERPFQILERFLYLKNNLNQESEEQRQTQNELTQRDQQLKKIQTEKNKWLGLILKKIQNQNLGLEEADKEVLSELIYSDLEKESLNCQQDLLIGILNLNVQIYLKKYLKKDN